MAGLLTYMMNAADSSKRRIKSLLDDPIGVLTADADRNIQAYTKPNVSEMSANYLGAGMIPGGLGMTVWHGSPHKFKKFDMSKIGTGEGAQAYGHGLYMAESPEVAGSYSGKLSSELKYAGRLMNRDSGRNTKDSAAWALYLSNGDKEAAKASGLAKPELIDALDPAKLKPGGQLYKVDIPDEAVARMLDWDKPLSEQPEILAKAKQLHQDLGELYPSVGEVVATPGIFDGQHLYQALINGDKSSEAAARSAKAMGIPGIRYLDGGSRSGGQGTSNFVLFDDQMPRILEINGQATGNQPWKPGEWPSLLGESRPKTQYELAHELAQQRAALPVEQGGLGLPVNNTAMDRARAMGGMPAYHGTSSDVKQLDKAMFGSSTGAESAKRAWWAVDDPTTARGYAEYSANQAPIKRLLDQADRFEKKGDWDAYDNAVAQAEELEARFSDNPLNGQNIMPLMVMPRNPRIMDAKGAEFTDVEGGVNNFLRQSKQGGNDVAIIQNLSDDVGFNGRPATHFGIIDPASVRSRFAAFDPFRRNEADLLASRLLPIGGAGLLGLGLLGSDDSYAK